MTAERPGLARRLIGGIRTRILVGYLALALLALAASLLIVRQVLHTRLESQIERDLVQEVEELRNLAATGVDRETGEPLGEDVEAIFDAFLQTNVPVEGEAFFTIIDGKPDRLSAEAPANLLSDPDLLDTWTGLESSLRLTTSSPAGEARTLAVPLRSSSAMGGVFVVAAFPAEALQELDDALRSIALASGLVVLLAAAAAWGLAGRVVRPVRELTDTARSISDSDLTARIPVEGHDELAELGTTFNAMLDRLEHGMRSQRQFLDSVAHELRTPLTIARGHLEVSGGSADDREATARLVTEELDRMARYVDDLLVLAKAEQPDFLHMEPVDVGELVAALLQRAPTLADRRWVADEAPGPGVLAAVADGGRLEQAMLSLLTNATQHTGDGDEIGIGARARGDEVELWVRDHGPGVPPALQESIFDRSVRGARSQERRPEGTGIGLSIVRTIALAHRGSVAVSDTPGGGATFTITIPLDPEEDTP